MSADERIQTAAEASKTATQETVSVPKRSGDTVDPTVLGGIVALYRLLWRSARGVRVRLCAALILQALGFSCAWAAPFLLGQAVNVAQASGGRDLDGMLDWIGLAPVSVALMWALAGPGRILERQVAVSVQRTLISDLSDRALTASIRWHEGRHSGETTSRIDTSVRAVVSFAESQSFYLKSLFNLLGVGVAMAVVCWPVAILAVIGFATLTWWMFRLDGRLSTQLDGHTLAANRLTATLSDTLGNITTIKALGADRAAHRTIMASVGVVERRARAIVVPMERKWWVITYGSGVLTAVLLAGYAVASWERSGLVQAGYLVMIGGYAGTLQGAFEVMGGHWQALLRFQSEGRDTDELAATVSEMADHTAVPVDWETITIRDLHLVHPDRLDDPRGPAHVDRTSRAFDVEVVDLSVRRGERIALVGPNGSGKSTLMRALTGMYRCERLVVEVDGRVIPDVRSLSSVAGFLPQDVEIFETTVRHNIDLGSGVDDHELNAVAEYAGLGSVLADLPAGMDTHLAERGVNLSGGQKQRVGLARGLLMTKDRSLLLLDEPTSNLDTVAESAIYTGLIRARPDVAIVSALHRLHLLRHFDTVILMDGGRIVDHGSPSEVMKRQPGLRAMLASTSESSRERSESSDTHEVR